MLFTADRRLVVDQGFDRTVETVLQAFLDAGFSVTPIEGGDLQQKSGHRRTSPLRGLRSDAAGAWFRQEFALAGVPADSRLLHLGLRSHRQLHLRHDVESVGPLPAAGLARATALRANPAVRSDWWP